VLDHPVPRLHCAPDRAARRLRAAAPWRRSSSSPPVGWVAWPPPR